VCFIVCSSQDHLGTGTHDLDQPISCRCKKHRQIVSQFIHESDIIQGEEVIYLDDTGTSHFTLLVIPKSHILHVPLVIQASIDHLHRMRKGRWLSTGVSEIDLRNPTLSHTTRGSLNIILHFTI
jgi:hypothetical protein